MPSRDRGIFSKHGDDLPVRTIILTLVACLVSLTLCFAEDLNIGTWKLNEAKSNSVPESEKVTRWLSKPLAMT
jgi:hypothetical protein